MNENMRMVATAIIWGSFTIIIGVILAVLAMTGVEMNEVGIGALLIVLISLMVTVANSTMAIWSHESKGDQGRESLSEATRQAKSKREASRIERLIEDLNDDEIYDLEALLLARDQSNASRQDGA